MIDVADVCPTRREGRALTRGWGTAHWVCVLPTYAFLVGLLVFGVLAVSMAGDHLPGGLFASVLFCSWVTWTLGLKWQRRSLETEARKAPVGGLPWRWRIDGAGLSFDNGLQSNRVDWRAVKAVQEEKDRYVFLVSPAYNPVLPKRLLSEQQRSDLDCLIGDVRLSGKLGAGPDGD